MIDKVCKKCGVQFTVADEDLAFYKKISPTFDGKTFGIPAPTLCPECRQMRRLVWRNEKCLYQRKCDLCSKKIVSIYSLDHKDIVYCQDCWWSDSWEAPELDYSCEEKSFFKQLSNLKNKCPRIGTSVIRSVNCEYCPSNTIDSKNCYMTISTRGEDCMYGRKIIDCRNVMDITFGVDCEKCYEVVFSSKCYDCKFITYCEGCSESSFLFNCRNCQNCLMCSNLSGKQYFYKNKRYSSAEYKKIVDRYWNGSYQKMIKNKDEYQKLILNSVRKQDENKACENCIGNDLTECSNCSFCFEVTEGTGCKFHCDSIGGEAGPRYCMDCDLVTNSELVLDSISGYRIYECSFVSWCHDSKNLLYCIDCQNGCHDCFGCVGLKHKQYCILNKQYTRQQYEQKVGEIISGMIIYGEWGEFFPMEMCSFAYNKTLADDFYPLSKHMAEKYGSYWVDDTANDDAIRKYIPEDNICEYSRDKQKVRSLLDSVLTCEVSGQPFKILPQELAFYIENKIPLPRRSFLTRYNDRARMHNPRKLYHRQCMCEESDHGHEGRCTNEFETTYAPDRPEKVYCEECYRKAVL